jgi:hypothetical protein
VTCSTTHLVQQPIQTFDFQVSYHTIFLSSRLYLILVDIRRSARPVRIPVQLRRAEFQEHGRQLFGTIQSVHLMLMKRLIACE